MTLLLSLRMVTVATKLNCTNFDVESLNLRQILRERYVSVLQYKLIAAFPSSQMSDAMISPTAAVSVVRISDIAESEESNKQNGLSSVNGSTI